MVPNGTYADYHYNTWHTWTTGGDTYTTTETVESYYWTETPYTDVSTGGYWANQCPLTEFRSFYSLIKGYECTHQDSHRYITGAKYKLQQFDYNPQTYYMCSQHKTATHSYGGGSATGLPCAIKETTTVTTTHTTPFVSVPFTVYTKKLKVVPIEGSFEGSLYKLIYF